MERTIRVTGKGKISVKPDLIRLLLELEGVYKEYGEVLKKSSEQVELLKDCFEKLGFARSDLKTINFNVDTKYESYQDFHKNWKKKFIGYKFSHALKIEFPADNKKLGAALYALAQAPIQPEFEINYTIKDTESAKNELLGKAIADSKEKAKVLTEAAEVALGDIILIDYSWGEISFTSKPMQRAMLLEDCDYYEDECYDMDIEPDDIDVSDIVTVIWEIK